MTSPAAIWLAIWSGKTVIKGLAELSLQKYDFVIDKTGALCAFY
jgi:hypothetical protein